MWNRIKSGWSFACGQPFAVFALFAYHLIWGVALYKLVQSVLLPLLHRYPNELSPEAVQLFWIEGQFQLMKTDMADPLLWWGLALLGLRLLLHPLLNAGVYYSLHHTKLNAGYRFVEGVRKLSLPFFGYYALQLLLMLVPLIWLAPYLWGHFSKQASYVELGQALLPALLAYVGYLFLIQLFFMHLQIGLTRGRSPLFAAIFALRHLPAIVLAALIVLAITALAAAAVMASAFIWAGFLALVGVQAYRLAQMLFKVWAIGTQYALWAEKA
ncbi:hypothetical protein SAMN02799630_02366 [Paenibacillus sp. UNCCL117]|uniref:hypothetical protein n=1 Tax=unclassified Paenibacillus TaxID=185978 RepID=UPI0008896F16|nr:MULTISPECIES: hypothetical protein [unclassified Paenibacillus]SDD19005.1 hypothetical protein SAMN04488602_106242 [Paenibacillus sp. cl123]SFW35382.1 hypothetical protein SAMN02799630_02366 [Paenibacillus sp. UNCCL117]